MPVDSGPEVAGEAIPLAECVERYGDPAGLELLARLRGELGDAQVAKILSGRPMSHWEVRALAKHGFDPDELRAALVGPILEQIAAGALLCKGFDAAQVASRMWISIPAVRAGAFAFDFAASEATGGDLLLTSVVATPSKKMKVGPKRASRDVVRKWYRARVDSLVAAGMRSNFAMDMEAAESEFGINRVTENLIKEIRRDMAPDSWKKPGPRPKQPDTDPAEKSSG